MNYIRHKIQLNNLNKSDKILIRSEDILESYKSVFNHFSYISDIDKEKELYNECSSCFRQ